MAFLLAPSPRPLRGHTPAVRARLRRADPRVGRDPPAADRHGQSRRGARSAMRRPVSPRPFATRHAVTSTPERCCCGSISRLDGGPSRQLGVEAVESECGTSAGPFHYSRKLTGRPARRATRTHIGREDSAHGTGRFRPSGPPRWRLVGRVAVVVDRLDRYHRPHQGSPTAHRARSQPPGRLARVAERGLVRVFVPVNDRRRHPGQGGRGGLHRGRCLAPRRDRCGRSGTGRLDAAAGPWLREGEGCARRPTAGAASCRSPRSGGRAPAGPGVAGRTGE